MCHKLDPRFFAQLAAMPADDVCRRALCRFDPGRGCFQLEVWGNSYEVFPQKAEIRPLPGSRSASSELGLAIVFYLMECRDLPPANEWVSEKDIPGGIGFFSGQHAIPGRLVATRFGADVESFRRVCVSLGGAPLAMGDAAFAFHILPRAPVAVILWKEDDEFPADARLLFDRTIGQHLPLDVIFGLSEVVCARLAGAPDPGAGG